MTQCKMNQGPKKLPSLVVFDLDNTLWGLDGKHKLTLFPDVCPILREIANSPKWQHTRLAIASTTRQIKQAYRALNRFKLGDGSGRVLLDLFDQPLIQMHGGDKRTHFITLQRASGVPFNEMIFFDDLELNCASVKRLGVHTQRCDDGLKREIWDEALLKFSHQVQDWTVY